MRKAILLIVMLSSLSFAEKLNIELGVGSHNSYVVADRKFKEFVLVKANYKNFEFMYKGIKTEQSLNVDLDDEDVVAIKEIFENIFSVGFNTKYFDSHLIYNKPRLYSQNRVKYGKDLKVYAVINYCFNDNDIISHVGLIYQKKIKNFDVYLDGAVRLATLDDYKPIFVFNAGLSYTYKINEKMSFRISDNIEIIQKNFRNIIWFSIILSPEI